MFTLALSSTVGFYNNGSDVQYCGYCEIDSDDGIIIFYLYDTTYSATYVTEFVTVDLNGTTTAIVTDTSASAAFDSSIAMITSELSGSSGWPFGTVDVASVSFHSNATSCLPTVP